MIWIHFCFLIIMSMFILTLNNLLESKNKKTSKLVIDKLLNLKFSKTKDNIQNRALRIICFVNNTEFFYLYLRFQKFKSYKVNTNYSSLSFSLLLIKL